MEKEIKTSPIKFCLVCGCPIDIDDWFGSHQRDICAGCSLADDDNEEE